MQNKIEGIRQLDIEYRRLTKKLIANCPTRVMLGRYGVYRNLTRLKRVIDKSLKSAGFRTHRDCRDA